MFLNTNQSLQNFSLPAKAKIFHNNHIILIIRNENEIKKVNMNEKYSRPSNNKLNKLDVNKITHNITVMNTNTALIEIEVRHKHDTEIAVDIDIEKAKKNRSVIEII